MSNIIRQEPMDDELLDADGCSKVIETLLENVATEAVKYGADPNGILAVFAKPKDGTKPSGYRITSYADYVKANIELTITLIVIADAINMPYLFKLSCAALANTVKDMTSEEVGNIFGITKEKKEPYAGPNIHKYIR
ncbi:hypothetical protein KR018_007924 [Drosophila ironensis]|nr:hypothetical protein KR018_007924 [Drosophila ironensis]